MCGIVGLYLKNQTLENQLGSMFAPMLEAMTGRGPDSAGFAIYGDQAQEGSTKITLRHPDLEYDWDTLAHHAQTHLAVNVAFNRNHNAAVFKMATDAKTANAYFATHAPEVALLSAGQSIEILKAVGLPGDISSDFNLTSMQGSHIIGHTRMATESAVTLEGSHPFSTGQDLCLVHNGSFSNHNRLRTELAYHGYQMKTENDTEVAAGYLTWRMDQGDTLDQSLQHALQDLDGFYTLAIGTKNGFAVIRDPIACKPAVLAETDDYVAMASEYQALTSLVNIENARIWEPEPATIYSWQRDSQQG